MTMETLLRNELDEIMTIIGADEEQTYFGLADKVREWKETKEAA
jgi:hypothetical protein